MSNSRESVVVIRYNNRKSAVITDELGSFQYTDNASGEADTVSFCLNNASLGWLKKGWFPKESDYVRVSICVRNWRWPGDTRTVYQGKFAVDEFGAEGFPSVVEFGGISVPIRTGIHLTERNKTYRKTSVKGILSVIAKRAGVKLAFSGKDCSVEEVSQDGDTDMEFAFRLCSEYDLAVKLYNGKIVVYQRTAYERRKGSFTLRPGDLGEGGTYRFQYSVTKLYDSVKLRYQNKDGKKITYSYTIPGKSGKRTLVLSDSADCVADAEKKAKARLAESLRQVVTATFSVMGDPRYRACETFYLTGFGRFDGKYFIDQVTHSKEGGYTSSIQCHRCVTGIE